MSDRNDEQDILKSIKQHLNESEQNIDQDTLRQLRLSRHAAIQQLDQKKNSWVPAVATVTMAAVVTVAGLQIMQPGSVDVSSPFIEDMNLLSASEELELYENLEFYQWLELEERTS